MCEAKCEPLCAASFSVADVNLCVSMCDYVGCFGKVQLHADSYRPARNETCDKALDNALFDIVGSPSDSIVSKSGMVVPKI